MRHCVTCKWYAKVGETAYGECRVVEPMADWDRRAYWPVVHETDYCGRHVQRPVVPTNSG